MSLAWSTERSGHSDYPASQAPVSATERALPGRSLMSLQIFFYLQALDFLTTLIGLKLGISEASPFIRSLMHFGPGIAVAASKIVAIMLAVLCIKLNRSRLLRYVNFWYAGIVVWNLVNILIV